MKNLKVLLITALVSVALLSYADKHPKNVKTITKISITKVSTVPGLTGAIYSQVNPKLVMFEKQTSYHAVVTLNKKAYYVFGSRQAWSRFFNLKPVSKGVGSNGFSRLTQGNL